VKEDVEGESRLIPSERLGDQDEMTGRRDRDELGDALDGAQDQGLEARHGRGA
jgi:hypothetical protein